MSSNSFLDPEVGYTLEFEPLNSKLRLKALELLSSADISAPPIPIQRLAHLKGVTKILKEDLGDIDAILTRQGDGFIIRINPSISRIPQRQAFSIAHEIGHILLMETLRELQEAKCRVISMSKSIEERLCNIIATELLMPKEMFERKACETGCSLRSVRRLSGIFHTSILATAIRLVEVMPEPTILIRWDFTDRPGNKQKKIRVKWSAGAKMRTPGESSYFIPPYKSVADDSSVFNAYHTEEMIATTESINLGNLKGNFFIESQGFGTGCYRHVISFVYLNRKA